MPTLGKDSEHNGGIVVYCLIIFVLAHKERKCCLAVSVNICAINKEQSKAKQMGAHIV